MAAKGRWITKNFFFLACCGGGGVVARNLKNLTLFIHDWDIDGAEKTNKNKVS